MNPSDRKYGPTALLLTGIFLFMVLLNVLAPLRGDDFLYSMVWNTSKHITTWDDLVQSLYNHYMTHGGRMVTVFFLDLFLWMGKLPFDLANAAVFTATALLLTFHIRRQVTFAAPGTLALTALFMWLCLPHFGEVAVWKSGSTVYLWSGLFILLFLLPYNLHLAGRLAWGRAMALPMLLSGVLGGWSVENGAVTAVILAMGSTWYARKHGSAPLWMYAGTLGAVIGLLGLVLAPGNYMRYEAQGAGKGILRHIGNQIAGNGEMILYILPLLLLALLVWTALKYTLLARAGMTIPTAPQRFTPGQCLPLVLMAILAASYFAGGLLGDWIGAGLIAGVLEPLGKATPKAVYQLSHVMDGFEEMAIWWTGIFFVHYEVLRTLGWTRSVRKAIHRSVSHRAVWHAFPAVRYAGFLVCCAALNNLILLGGPTFPARATFSSVMMIIAATVVLLLMPEARAILAGPARRMLLAGGAVLGGFVAVATVTISWAITRENDWRIAYIAERANTGAVVALPPIEIKSRALRHVFYKEFEIGRRRAFMMNRYYGIKDVVLVKPRQ